MPFYSLRTALDDCRITKFDNDLNVESSYIIGASPPHECECPAGTRPTCRHRQMLPDLLPILDTELFWDFDRRQCVNSSGMVCEPIEGLDENPDTLPDGLERDNALDTDIQVISLGEPADLHNAIATALPELTQPARPWRRI